MSYAIDIRAVTRRFGRRTVLDGFSLTVEPGECVTLCGPSGCGKTTLLRIVAGLDQADTGAVTFRNAAGPDISPPLTDGTVGMVFQDLALWPHMRAARHLEFVLRGRGLARRARKGRVRDLLALTGLAPLARSYPAQMSGGEQQRLAFARTLATEPRILLLDEPFANLDPANVDRLVGELARRKAESKVTMIIATHDPGETLTLADRRIDFG